MYVVTFVMYDVTLIRVLTRMRDFLYLVSGCPFTYPFCTLRILIASINRCTN